MSARMTIEHDAGTSIERACEDACRVANLLGINVEFGFNSVTCLAQPWGSSAELAEKQQKEQARKLSGPLDRRFATTDSKSALAFLRSTAGDE